MKLQAKEVNAITGEETFRDLTSEELAEIEAGQAKMAALAEEENAKQAARKTVLDKLGLTAEEAAILLG